MRHLNLIARLTVYYKDEDEDHGVLTAWLQGFRLT